MSFFDFTISGFPSLANGISPSINQTKNPKLTNFPTVDTFTIAGYTMPGRWILTDAEKVFGWQIQQGFAQNGAFVFPKGDELIVPKFEGTIWADSDVSLYKSIRKQLLIKPVFVGNASRAVNAFGIDHPELKAMGVDAVVVGKISPLIDQGGGKWMSKIEFLQYRAPILAPPRPTQVISDTTRTPPTDSVTASEITRDKLNEDANAAQAEANR